MGSKKCLHEFPSKWSSRSRLHSLLRQTDARTNTALTSIHFMSDYRGDVTQQVTRRVFSTTDNVILLL